MEKNSLIFKIIANRATSVIGEVENTLHSLLENEEDAIIKMEGYKSAFYESFYDYNGTKYNFVGAKKDGYNISLLGNPVVNGEAITDKVVEVKFYNYEKIYLLNFVMAYHEYLEHEQMMKEKKKMENNEDEENDMD